MLAPPHHLTLTLSTDRASSTISFSSSPHIAPSFQAEYYQTNLDTMNPKRSESRESHQTVAVTVNLNQSINPFQLPIRHPPTNLSNHHPITPLSQLFQGNWSTSL
mmetsp:Transcript_17464/g.36258  ORF Transcript_17464/g.36258 Transcript_17464/m.36258 type:complete len:105 (+) Transcript_17464:1010-1324(+)